MKPACDGCKKAEVECQRKERGPGCVRCAQRKSKCSVVGEKKKMSEKTTKTWSEVKEGLSSRKTPVLEMDQGFVEMVELMAGDLGTMSRSVYHMGTAIGRMANLMEIWMADRRYEQTEKVRRKVDEEIQTEPEVWRVDRIVDMEDDMEEAGKKDENGEDGDKDGDGEEMEIGE